MDNFIAYVSNPSNIGIVFSLGLLILALCLIMPLQAYRRGHGFLSWFILQIMAMNPLYLLVIVALLPNKAKMRQREKYTAELEAKLAGR